MENNTPPVCNYEGSDYQTSFWDEGGRAYEDAVEAVALQRLLPKSGSLMLELGAGAGRNTPRFSGYDRVVLVDYSRTQLEQAKLRLGDQQKYIYVAADIYRLPFVNQLFDGATMIRTLHHMADAPLALGQVNRVIQPGGTFILEYASKLNLKAILRYALKLQSWSPFDPAPIEFAALNFDFHPATIRTWLKEAGFQIERQLTVSHLRFPVFKKLIPMSILVGLDSLFQYTGDLWQLTPSVFTRSHSTKEQDDKQSTGFFQCPLCGNADLKEDTNMLICMNCGRHWSHENGIYDFRS
jgi:ubiquinone/menaquinone biosynthesis C-methylase UbiE